MLILNYFHLGIKSKMTEGKKLGWKVHQKLEEAIERENKNIIEDKVSKSYCEGFLKNYSGLLNFKDIIFQIAQRNFRTFERIYNKEIRL